MKYYECANYFDNITNLILVINKKKKKPYQFINSTCLISLVPLMMNYECANYFDHITSLILVIN